MVSSDSSYSNFSQIMPMKGKLFFEDWKYEEQKEDKKRRVRRLRERRRKRR